MRQKDKAARLELHRASRDKKRGESLKHNRVPLSKITHVGR